MSASVPGSISPWPRCSTRRAHYAEAAAHLELANMHSDLGLGGAWPDLRRQSRIPASSTDSSPRSPSTASVDRRRWGQPDPQPVFIVGLPRSGTTLVEQILASHPDVHGVGELQRLASRLSELAGDRRLGLGTIPVAHSMPLTGRRRELRRGRYLDRLESFMPGPAARVVDKMPDNIHFLGLIALLWPNARVDRLQP